MKLTILIVTLIVYAICATAALAGDYKVFGIRTDFPMADGQQLFRDVYVNMGTNQGIKTGSSLDAYRIVTSVDELNQRTGKNTAFKIARLKVIHADTDLAVARVVQFLPPETTPLGAFTNVMVGDEVEVGKK
ncbi:MAG TPA: hypothetical protein VIH99_05490 [Bdellovibrionota bacterium]|jgi:hypothetical protein